MAEQTFFGNRGKLYIKEDAGAGTSQPIAVLKGLECTVNFEHVPLYGTDSIIRQDVAKHTAKVEVKIKSAKFDPDITTGTGLAAIYAAVLDGHHSGATTITDTNDEALFEVRFFPKGTSATATYMSIIVGNVYFESLPFPMPENEYTVFDLTGVGDNVVFGTNATPA